jgi:hypothetical protein
MQLQLPAKLIQMFVRQAHVHHQAGLARKRPELLLKLVRELLAEHVVDRVLDPRLPLG